MLFRLRFKVIHFIFLFFASLISVSAQEVRVELSTIDSLNLSDTTNKVPDINGELCSLIILTTELEGLKFYTNLGVEKIIRTDDGYQIWIPNQASVLKFTIPGFPLFEYKLPFTDFKYAVYIILLKADTNERIVLKDTTKSSLSFYIYPLNSKIYINGKYRGRSPLVIENPEFNTFNYTIKKKRYEKYSAQDSLDVRSKMISKELGDLFRSSRYFLSANIRMEGSFEKGFEADSKPILGFMFGVLGKPGFYGSLNMAYSNNIETGSNTNDGIVRKYDISAGITMQGGKSLFFYGGPGYINRYYEYNRGNGLNTYKSQGVYLNVGLMVRIGWYSILSFNFRSSITDTYESIGLGFGFNFPKKTKNGDKI